MRRTFWTIVCALVGAAPAACGGAAAPGEPPPPSPSVETVADTPAVQRFEGWLDTAARADAPAVRDLYYAYYDTRAHAPWFLSTMISAEVVRFRIARGDLPGARVTADALLAWQHPGDGPVGARLRGAFPSELAPDPSEPRGYAARYLYDTGDNLSVCGALLSLYEATRDAKYLDAAEAVGRWLRDVMAHGETWGVWLAPLGAPMQAVTRSGDFDNRVPVGRTLFRLPVLRRLSRLTGDASFADLAATSYALLARGVSEEGAPMDHYDPGWPPVAFDPARFRPYGDESVVADDSLRAGIGLAAEGDSAASSRVAGWVKHTPGRIPGYLDVHTGAAYFPAGNVPYDDVVSSSIYAALARRLGRADADDAARFAAGAQADDGGFWWGKDHAGGGPIDANESTLTGLWGFVDLTPEG